MTVHGRRSTYVNQGCRCLGCRAANANYHQQWRAGRTRMCDTDGPAADLSLLLEGGWSVTLIAEVTGLSAATLRVLRRGDTATTRPSTAAALADLVDRHVDMPTVDYTHLRGILWHLSRRGWPTDDVADETGLPAAELHRIVNGARGAMPAHRAQRIDDLYETTVPPLVDVRVPFAPLEQAYAAAGVAPYARLGDADSRAWSRASRTGDVRADVAERIASRIGENLTTVYGQIV